MKKVTALIAAVLLIAIVVACGREEPEPEFPNPLLAQVPADAPYLFANGEPLPEGFTQRWERAIKPLFDDMKSNLDSSFSELEEKHPDVARRLRAALKELLTIADEDGMKAAGFTYEDKAVFYGDGLMPVMRMTLTDPEAFRDYIGRVLNAAEIQVPTAEHNGVEYWRGELGPALLVAGIDGNVFSAGVKPMDQQDRLLAHLFGDGSPERSAAEAGTLSAMVDDHGFLRHGAGYIDSVRLASLLIGEGPDSPGLLDSMEIMPVELSSECRGELKDIVAKAPRMVFGYDAVSDDRMKVRSVLELEPAIAQEMAGWAAPVPGLGTSDDARIVFGYGVDFVKAGNSLQNWFRQAADREFACAMLNSVQWRKSAGQVNTAPLYMAGNPKGMVMRLDELEIDHLSLDDEAQQAEFTIKGSMVMLFENAQTLAAMAKGFIPGLQNFDLPADGTPVPLPDQARDHFDQPAFIAMTDTVMGVSVGEDGENTLRAAMQAPVAESPPILDMVFDAGWLYTKMADWMPKLAEQGEDLDPETREQMKQSAEALRTYGEIFGRLRYSIALTERGVTFRQDIALR